MKQEQIQKNIPDCIESKVKKYEEKYKEIGIEPAKKVKDYSTKGNFHIVSDHRSDFKNCK